MRNTITEILEAIYEQCKSSTEGAVADYIPELTKVDPEWYGIAIVTADGHSYTIGDTGCDFTIQSISKVFTFGMALDEYGEEALSHKIGVEPSGEAFNEISLDPETGRPSNPMINAGAIAAAAQISGENLDDRFERIRKCYSSYAGRELTLENDVYASESATGFRNRAIAYLLRNADIIQDPVDDNCELYFKQCSLLVNCLDLATMGATLANNGVNPKSGERVLQAKHASKVLSVMGACGMYDGSGEWIYQVGLPSKSGVGGGILGVLPGQMGIAVFSPRLDAKGNSVRGAKTFEILSQYLGLHMLNLTPLDTASIIRSVRALSDIESSQARPEPEVELIRQHGDEVAVIEVQGSLSFGSTERIVRVMQQDCPNAMEIILDLSRVGQVDEASKKILRETSRALVEAERILHFIDPAETLDWSREGEEALSVFTSREFVLEGAESRLIQKYESSQEGVYALSDFEVFKGFELEELKIVRRVGTYQSYEEGDYIICQGSKPDGFYLLAEGLVGIFISENGRTRAVRRFCPGVSFGDIALIEDTVRSADVIAEKKSWCWVISKEAFTELENDHPTLYSKLLKNLLCINTRLLRENTRQIALLSSVKP